MTEATTLFFLVILRDRQQFFFISLNRDISVVTSLRRSSPLLLLSSTKCSELVPSSSLHPSGRQTEEERRRTAPHGPIPAVIPGFWGGGAWKKLSFFHRLESKIFKKMFVTRCVSVCVCAGVGGEGGGVFGLRRSAW